MKVTGFSFVKNALIYDYPIVEAIQSILPICDDFVIAIGKSDDETLALIQSIDSNKITILETEWDETLREGGRVLAVETDKAFQAISKETDWAFYIQGDEVVSEKYLPTIKKAMEEYQSNDEVDGLLFKYKHFYGSYDYVGASSKWYGEEIRVIKNNKKIYSYKDAQGFRKNDNEKLKVVPIDAYIYHYGWVKDPRAMQLKQENFNKLWHDDDWVKENVVEAEEFDYTAGMSKLEIFREQHPKVMQKRIEEKNWKFSHDISLNKTSLKDRAKKVLKSIGIDTSYKNYELAKIHKKR